MRYSRLVVLVTLPFILAACRHFGPLYEYNGPDASVSTGALVVIGIREAAPAKLPADHFFVVYVRSYDPDTLTLNRRIPTKNNMSFAGLTEAGSDEIDVNFQTTSPFHPPWITKVENEFEKAQKVFDEIGLGGELVNRPLKASW